MHVRARVPDERLMSRSEENKLQTWRAFNRRRLSSVYCKHEQRPRRRLRPSIGSSPPRPQLTRDLRTALKFVRY